MSFPVPTFPGSRRRERKKKEIKKMFLSRQSSLGSDTGYDQYVYDEEEPNASEDTKKTSVHFDDVDDDEETEHYKKPKGSPRLSGLFHRYAHGEEGSQMLLGSSKKSFNSSNHNLQGGGRITPRGTSSGQMRRISPTAATSQGNLRIRSPRTSNPNLLLPEGVCRSTSSNSVNGGATRRSLSKGHLQTLDREEDPERWRQASLAAARGRLSRNGSKAMIGMEMGSCEADVNEVIEAPDAVGMLWTWPYSICLPISRYVRSFCYVLFATRKLTLMYVNVVISFTSIPWQILLYGTPFCTSQSHESHFFYDHVGYLGSMYYLGCCPSTTAASSSTRI